MHGEGCVCGCAIVQLVGFPVKLGGWGISLCEAGSLVM